MYIISDTNLSFSILMDKHFDDTTPTLDKTINKSRSVTNTFGRFPHVYYAGHTNYETFTLSTLFVPEPNKTAHQQYDNFVAKLSQNNLTITDGFRRKYLADIHLTGYKVSKLGTTGYHDYIEVVVEVTQLGVIEEVY